MTPANRSVSFAHPAEEEFSRILSFYRVRWLYEPTSFVLARDPDGKPLESFTPDFYLPDHQLFIELTTMKQALVTRKNRKLRRLRELYPGVRIKLLYRRDVERLLRAYAPPRAPIHAPRIENVIVGEQALRSRIDGLAREVLDWHREDASGQCDASAGRALAVISAAPGAATFQRHLSAELANAGLAHHLDRMRVTRYPTRHGYSRVRVASSPRRSIAGYDILIVTDQVNTGLSLAYLVAWLKRRGACRVEVCTLIRRPQAALIDTPIRFVGFEIADVPIAGFGLDTPGRFRQLPYLATLVGGMVDAADNLV